MDIDFSKAGSYKGKKWLELEAKLAKFQGKVRRFKSANSEEWTEVKKGRLFIGGSEVIENDFGIWGGNFQTIDGKHTITETYVYGMKKDLLPFTIRKRSEFQKVPKLWRKK